MRKGIGIRIWMPQWIPILDYADSYAYLFCWLRCRGIDRTSSIQDSLSGTGSKKNFLFCASGGLGSLGLAIPGKSEVNQKPRSCKQHKKGFLVRAWWLSAFVTFLYCTGTCIQHLFSLSRSTFCCVTSMVSWIFFLVVIDLLSQDSIC